MIIKLYEENPNPRQVNQIVESLAAGGLVIIPTDTVYGIACSLSNVQAIETLAEIRSKKLKRLISQLCVTILVRYQKLQNPFLHKHSNC